jgi:cytochrome d ubiquinol oxidase subunit I
VLRGRAVPRLALRALALLTFAGWVAVLAGWYVTEIGRQPWIVYGELAVADVVADHTAVVMRGTLLAYALLYAVLLAAYVTTLRHLSAKPAASLQMRAGEQALVDRGQ